MISSHLLSQSTPMVRSSFHLPYRQFPPVLQHNPDSINKWFPWQSLSWFQSLTKNLHETVPACKIEEAPQSLYQNYQITVPQIEGFVKHEAPSSQKYQETGDIFANLQRKALRLIRQNRLTFEEIYELKKYRAMRIDFYLVKKSRRNYRKKIVYDTRKKVADRRIRYKGKFINESQAKGLLGLEGQSYSFQQLRRRMKDGHALVG